METIKTPATFDKVTILRDKSLKLSFETQECGADFIAELIQWQGDFGYLTFSKDQNEQVPTPDLADLDKGKTPGQRLRAVLFRVWQHEGQTGEFEIFYRNAMEHFITLCKKKLD